MSDENINILRKMIESLGEKIDTVTCKVQDLFVAVTEIKTQLAFGERRFEDIEKDVLNIQKECQESGCKNLLIGSALQHLTRHEGDLLQLFEILSSKYGNEGISGYKLLVKIMDSFVNTKSFTKMIKDETARKIISFVVAGAIAFLAFAGGLFISKYLK
jgi:hypothetical protein